MPKASEIELASGRYLDLADPDPAVITVEDVAAGLGRMCRFAGQCRIFYSVAQHAVFVSRYLEEAGWATAVCLAGLHHDDSEAFLGDVTRPLKRLLPEYGRLEWKMTAACASALRLPAISVDERQVVKDADNYALALEAYRLMPSEGRDWEDGLRDSVLAGPDLYPLGPELARDGFLARHHELTGGSPYIHFGLSPVKDIFLNLLAGRGS